MMATPIRACRACQRQVLDAFTSLANINVNVGVASVKSSRTTILRPVTRQSRSWIAPVRSLHTTVLRYQSSYTDDKVNVNSQPTPHDPTLSETSETSIETEPITDTTQINTETAARIDQTESTDNVTTKHVPWYLQVAPPAPLHVRPVSLLADELPPIPEDSPAILSSILTHLSVSIGLDNLALLDLRGLNPPSPLGANLLMIIGTARSERHLNNSADRFCRWVRSTYKLRPYADGLLGRNELKLKLRRRNRKLKLAQSVGNTMYDSKTYDDGITTGWICCNLGAVDGAVMPEGESVHEEFDQKDQERFLDGEDEYRNPSEDSVMEPDFKYRGFGSASTSPRIVVQMFVEEKRVEMDLEGLWEARIKRRGDKAERRDQQARLQEDEDDFETSRIEAELDVPSEGFRSRRRF